MQTGLMSWKIAKGLYLIPVLFAFTPLVTGTWAERLTVFGFASLGLYALAGILQGHLEKKLTMATWSLLLISAFLLLWPSSLITVHLVGAGILIGVIIWQRRLSTH